MRLARRDDWANDQVASACGAGKLRRLWRRCRTGRKGGANACSPGRGYKGGADRLPAHCSKFLLALPNLARWQGRSSYPAPLELRPSCGSHRHAAPLPPKEASEVAALLQQGGYLQALHDTINAVGSPNSS